MWLSKLVLNPRLRHVQQDLADCHQMHRTLMSVWPEMPNQSNPRHALGLLYRVEPVRPGHGRVVLVQSDQRPDWSALPPDYLSESSQVKFIGEVYEAVREGQVLRFRLRANPTRSLNRGADTRGVRVDLRREEDKRAWLERQGERHGFALVGGAAGLTITPSERLTGRHGKHGGADASAAVVVAASVFEGLLRVTATAAFVDALRHGVGRAKAYGCGLLSIAPGG